ncbi:MAG: SHOCT domain-containing protein [Spirochaetes bacterium]|nr:SHOCT domain-containing protein [Spirochaetota bacterium]
MYGMGGPFMLILWIAILLLIGFGVYYLVKNKGANQDSNEMPLDILKKRYARGEITKKEYEQMKNDLK